jgi:polar amino acid transport system substrate-binding protein
MLLSMAVRLIAAASFLCIMAGANAYADALADIRARGEIVIGVRDDDPPFGFRNDDGELQGLEIELARDIAERVGVPLKPFVINPTSRLQFIELALNDALIGMLAVTERRKQQARLVEPYYYATSISMLERPQDRAATVGLGAGGKTICGLNGAYYVDALAGPPAELKTVPVHTMQEARASLSKARCDAIAAETATLVMLQRRNRNLGAHKLVTADVQPLPWAIAINNKMAGSDFELLLSDAVADWHRSGKLKALEEKWLGRNTEWVLRQHDARQ